MTRDFALKLIQSVRICSPLVPAVDSKLRDVISMDVSYAISLRNLRIDIFMDRIIVRAFQSSHYYSDPSSMTTLRRWPTRESILSWWSDSNSLGATIPLHTLTKPLLKHLYHRQASGILNASPLSTDKIELLRTYLTFKDISPSTQVLVLDYLRLRAWLSEVEAQMIVHGSVLTHVDVLLQSSDPDIILHTCRMLRKIAYYDSLHRDILKLNPCMRVVSLLTHRNTRVKEEAVNVLACISAGAEDSARSAIDANALAHSSKLLASKNFGVRMHTCWMLGNIARHPDLNATVIELDVCARLGSLLSPIQWHISSGTRREMNWFRTSARECSFVQRNVVYALTAISWGSERGARAVLDANALANLPQLLGSPNPEVVRLTCSMLANIARHPSLNPRVRDVHPLTQIVSLLKTTSLHVGPEAKHALRCIISGAEDRLGSDVDGPGRDKIPWILGASIDAGGR
ncbi:armadillo-type protein [Mycena vulgaris]|nr:armadillo-type protein [Mycena vulgaris]